MSAHCPQCGSARLHRSRRRDKTEFALAIVGGRFRRCHECQSRFLLWGAALIRQGRLSQFTRQLALMAMMVVALLVVLFTILWLGHSQSSPGPTASLTSFTALS